MNQTTDHPSLPETQVATPISRVREYIADGLRYWEPRRLIFNVVLGLAVVGDFIAARPQSSARLTFDKILLFFLLAVLANVCYCAAYIVDFFVQLSGLRVAWSKGRMVVLIVGTAFAAVIAHFFAMGIFTGN